jgi:hypothetical protein
MRPALGGHQRVDLVDDDRIDGLQRLMRVGREQEIERFRRRNQDVRGFPLEPRALGGRRVTGPDGDRRRVENIPARRGPVRDPRDRRPQVALHVDGQRLQR